MKIMVFLFLKVMTVAYNIRVEKIRLDNSGENVDMAELIHAEGYNATFEFISPGDPQYNGLVERMFATIYGMLRSMLNQAQVPLHVCRGVWAEAAKTATAMSNILVNYKSNKSAHEKFMGTKFEHLNTLHTLDEMAIVEDHQSHGMRSKFNNCGRPAMFFGVQPDHV
jgi:molybdenum cofactor biosynthesis enzyme MoaA